MLSKAINIVRLRSCWVFPSQHPKHNIKEPWKCSSFNLKIRYMSDKLEKYLVEQRNKLDVESPDDKSIWKGIERDLSTNNSSVNHLARKNILIRIRNIAAAAFILFSLGYITNDIIHTRKRVRSTTLSAIDINLGRRENEYKSLVSFKTKEVSSFSGSRDIVIKELFEEIGKLDLIYDQSMKDLKELGPDEKVINTIFSTYEQKIRLLELIIIETNKTDRHENDEKNNL